MEITTLLKETWKEDKVSLENAISSLKKEMKESKKARKSEWKLFKNKFHTDLDAITKSLKDLKNRHKKKKSVE